MKRRNMLYDFVYIEKCMALYDWLILAELDPNKFYGSFILFIIVYFYTKVENKKTVVNSDNNSN